MASRLQTDRHMLVSGIIIFFNASDFIEEAIASVLAQTYLEWELILVDDGSTDGSPGIAKAYAAAHPDRIRLYRHPDGRNHGMSASRNLGIRHARGECVGFLDADDVWLPRKLEQQVAILRQHPEAAVVCGATEIWHSWDPQAEQRDAVVQVVPPNRSDVSELLDAVVPPPNLLKHLYPLGPGPSISTSNYLIRRSALDGIGGFADDFRGIFEDQIMQTKIYAKLSVYVSSKCWDRYRQHPASCVAIHKATHADKGTAARFIYWLGHYLRDQDIQDPDIARLYFRAYLKFARPRMFALLRTTERRVSRRLARGAFRALARAHGLIGHRKISARKSPIAAM